MSASGGQCALNQTKRPPGLAMPKTLASRQSGHLGDAQRPVIRVSLAGHPSCRSTLPHVLAIIGGTTAKLGVPVGTRYCRSGSQAWGWGMEWILRLTVAGGEGHSVDIIDRHS